MSSKIKCAKCGMPLDMVTADEHTPTECINWLRTLYGLECLKADRYETQIAFDYSPTLRNIGKMCMAWIRLQMERW